MIKRFLTWGVRPKGRLFIWGLIFCFLPVMADAQLIFTNRPAIWPSLAVRKSFGDRWKVQIEHSTRLRFGPCNIDESYLQLSGEYQVSYNVALEMNYRFSEVYDPETYFTPAHRFSWEADYKGHVNRFSITVHPAVQAVISREIQMKDRDAAWAFRPKFAVDYNIRKSSLEPFVSFEFYTGQRGGEQFSIYKYRMSAGLSGDFTKNIKMTGYLRQQGGFFNTSVSSYSILGLDLLYKL